MQPIISTPRLHGVPIAVFLPGVVTACRASTLVYGPTGQDGLSPGLTFGEGLLCNRGLSFFFYSLKCISRFYNYVNLLTFCSYLRQSNCCSLTVAASALETLVHILIGLNSYIRIHDFLILIYPGSIRITGRVTNSSHCWHLA